MKITQCAYGTTNLNAAIPASTTETIGEVQEAQMCPAFLHL